MTSIRLASTVVVSIYENKKEAIASMSGLHAWLEAPMLMTTGHVCRSCSSSGGGGGGGSTNMVSLAPPTLAPPQAGQRRITLAES